MSVTTNTANTVNHKRIWVLVYGLSGSGKSTFAKQLQSELDQVYTRIVSFAEPVKRHVNDMLSCLTLGDEVIDHLKQEKELLRPIYVAYANAVRSFCYAHGGISTDYFATELLHNMHSDDETEVIIVDDHRFVTEAQTLIDAGENVCAVYVSETRKPLSQAQEEFHVHALRAYYRMNVSDYFHYHFTTRINTAYQIASQITHLLNML